MQIFTFSLKINFNLSLFSLHCINTNTMPYNFFRSIYVYVCIAHLPHTLSSELCIYIQFIYVIQITIWHILFLFIAIYFVLLVLSTIYIGTKLYYSQNSIQQSSKEKIRSFIIGFGWRFVQPQPYNTRPYIILYYRYKIIGHITIKLEYFGFILNAKWSFFVL